MDETATATATATEGAAAPAGNVAGAAAAAAKPEAAAETKPMEAKPSGLFAAAAAAQDGRPEGLPDQFWDAEKKEVRLAALVKAANDMRARLARGGEEAPPASADGYALPAVEGLPKELVPPNDDPVWSAVRKAAHEAGLTQKQLEAVARPYLAAVAEQAKQRQPATEQDAAAAYEAELARLGPQGRQVVHEVGAWLSGLVARGVMTGEEYAALQGISTAEGVRALAKLRSMAGEKPIPLSALDDGAMSYADAERMMREAFEKKDTRLGEQAARALRELAAKGRLPAA
jgi:hypothetical protein